MKGISPVIATILLLLITVAIVGIAFSFFTRTTSTLTTTTDTQVNSQVNQMQKIVSIDAFNATSVTLRSQGTATINAGEVAVYVNGSAINCAGLGAIAPLGIATCNFPLGSQYNCTGSSMSSTKMRVVLGATVLEQYC